MSQKYVVGVINDFPAGSHMVVEVNNRKIGIFNVDGELYALPNLCPHQVGPLCEGKVSGTLAAGPETDWKLQWTDEGKIVTCPWHGLEFYIETGRCLAYSQIKLRTYQAVIEENEVKIIF